VSTVPTPSPTALLRRAWAFDKPLAFVGSAMVVLLAAMLVGLVLDERVITGAPAWLKPMKFAVSIAIYCFTLLWLLTFVEGRRRLVKAVAAVTAVALGLELVLIAGAAGLGTTSHFNVSTPIQSAVWSTMGAAIVATWLANLVAAVLLLRQRLPEPALAWGLRLGLLVSFVGMGLAFFMTVPTPEQLALAEATGRVPIAGAHTVGAADGGPGLPVVGWSTVGGDVRAAHFLGLHALQALPLLGWLLGRGGRPAWLGAGDRRALVVIAGLAYLGLVVLLTSQALRGQPLIAPDALTLTALAALVLGAGGGAAVVLARGRRAARG